MTYWSWWNGYLHSAVICYHHFQSRKAFRPADWESNSL